MGRAAGQLRGRRPSRHRHLQAQQWLRLPQPHLHLLTRQQLRQKQRLQPWHHQPQRLSAPLAAALCQRGWILMCSSMPMQLQRQRRQQQLSQGGRLQGSPWAPPLLSCQQATEPSQPTAISQFGPVAAPSHQQMKPRAACCWRWPAMQQCSISRPQLQLRVTWPSCSGACVRSPLRASRLLYNTCAAPCQPLAMLARLSSSFLPRCLPALAAAD